MSQWWHQTLRLYELPLGTPVICVPNDCDGGAHSLVVGARGSIRNISRNDLTVQITIEDFSDVEGDVRDRLYVGRVWYVTPESEGAWKPVFNLLNPQGFILPEKIDELSKFVNDLHTSPSTQLPA